MGINYDQIEKEGKVRDIPETLNYISGSYEVNQFLDRWGIEHDPDSIVLSDSFNCVFYGEHEEEYQVWCVHKSVPYLEATAFKMDLDEINHHMIP